MIKPLKLRACPEFVEIESKLKKLDLDMKKSTTEITKATKEIKGKFPLCLDFDRPCRVVRRTKLDLWLT